MREYISSAIDKLTPTQQAYSSAIILASAITAAIAIAGISQDENSRTDGKKVVSIVANWIAQSGAGSLATIFFTTAAFANTFILGPFFWGREGYYNFHKNDKDDEIAGLLAN